LIACFVSAGPEYYSNFNRDSTDIATARIASRDDTIAAVADWLDGHDLSAIHDRFPVVDKTKRALCRIRDDVLAAVPEGRQCCYPELRHLIADIYHLRFRAKDRACEVSFYGKNEGPDARFSWGDCQLFEFQPDDNRTLAAVLKRWLCDRLQPSAMRTEFAWLKIGRLADYYENDRPLEGEFIQSWDYIEEFYRHGCFTFSDSVLAMIGAMRRAGYDRLLRAGQSMSCLGLSRSRRHGLRATGWPWAVARPGLPQIRTWTH